MKRHTIDPAILQAAIDGLESQRTRINDQIVAVRSMLDGGSRSKPNGRRRRKHHISKEGRARIAAATRKRWAALRREARATKKKAA